MSRERSARFREAYRARIVGWYNGYVHVVTAFAIGVSILYLCIQHVTNVTPLEWLVIPVAAIVANFFEWDTHKHLMHQQSRIPFLQIIHRNHMINHHQYFTDDNMHFHDHRDLRITIFPPYVLTLFFLVALPFGVAFGLLFSANAGWLFLSVAAAMGMLYEFVHLCCHCEENWFVRNCPIVNSARRHHTAHHNPGMMTNVNLNVTFPFWDWLCGTSDLDRGFVGHLFNGYDTRYVKAGLPVTLMPPVSGAHRPAGHEAKSADTAAGGAAKPSGAG